MKIEKNSKIQLHHFKIELNVISSTTNDPKKLTEEVKMCSSGTVYSAGLPDVEEITSRIKFPAGVVLWKILKL